MRTRLIKLILLGLACAVALSLNACTTLPIARGPVVFPGEQLHGFETTRCASRCP